MKFLNINYAVQKRSRRNVWCHHFFVPTIASFLAYVWFLLVLCVFYSKGKNYCVVTAYCNGKHLTQPLSLNGKIQKKKEKRKEKTELKRQVNDFQNPLKTEPQRPAGAIGAT